MKERYEVGIPVIVMLLIIFGIAGGIMAGLQYKTDQENKIVIGEGIVTDMEIQNDGGLASWIMYLVSIDGKEFEITEEQYYNINIGDYIIIYKGGKVTIIE